jgi:phosphate transport system protein
MIRSRYSNKSRQRAITPMLQQPDVTDSDWVDERVTVGRSFFRDMERLWSEMLKLAAVVEDAINRSIHALCDGQIEPADELKRRKRTVDRWEVQIERECVRILALHQPVASDLRRVAAVLKINNELERLCELAWHVAKRVRKLTDDPQALPIPQSLENLALKALDQIHDSLDALTQLSISIAESVIATDRQVDLGYRAVQKQLKVEIIRNSERINTWLRLVNTARNLERIADHAVKIAESVIYLKQGGILRHRPTDLSTDVSVDSATVSFAPKAIAPTRVER